MYIKGAESCATGVNGETGLHRAVPEVWVFSLGLTVDALATKLNLEGTRVETVTTWEASTYSSPFLPCLGGSSLLCVEQILPSSSFVVVAHLIPNWGEFWGSSQKGSFLTTLGSCRVGHDGSVRTVFSHGCYGACLATTQQDATHQIRGCALLLPDTQPLARQTEVWLRTPLVVHPVGTWRGRPFGQRRHQHYMEGRVYKIRS